MDGFIQHGQVLLEVCDNLVHGNLRGYAPDAGQYCVVVGGRRPTEIPLQ